MIAAMFAMLLQAATPSPAPTPEAQALGRRLAASGTLAALLPMMVAKDTEELVAAHPELTAAEKAELRNTAKTVADDGMNRLLTAEGNAFAAALSLADLQLLVAAAESDAARRQRAVMPQIIGATMQAAGELDLKRETITAFCAKTGRGCPKK